MKTPLIILLLAYIAACGYLFIVQKEHIYFPPNEVLRDIGEEIEIVNQAVTLRGWVVNKGKPDAIIYFGGNAENIGYNIPQFEKIFASHTVYLLNYRGYGGNKGEPSEQAFYSDAIAIYEQIKAQHQTISVIGRSLGTGIATYLATQKPVAKLVLITPFDSMKNMAREVFPLFPTSFLLTEEYNSLARAGKITAQTLLIIAEKDEVIPRKLSENLISHIPSKLLKTAIILGANHNNIATHLEYEASLQSFL